MGVRATGAERGRQKTSVAYTDRNPDPESCLVRGRARSTREVAQDILRRRDVARDAPALAEPFVQHRSAVRWVGAVLSRLDENTRHGVVASVCFCLFLPSGQARKPALEQPLSH